jgi:hypothetical protein
VAVGVAAIAAGAGVTAVVLVSGRHDPRTTASAAPTRHLEVLSGHPLGRRAAERLLQERFLPVPEDDGSGVRCSGREARPAHSVRRCHVVYPGGTERLVVLLTNASGVEVLSEP